MNERKVMRTQPVLQWVFAIILVGMGLFILSQNAVGFVLPVILFVVALLVIGFAASETLTVDPSTGKVLIQSSSLLKKKNTEVLISDIQTIEIDTLTTRGTQDRRKKTSFRTVIKKKDGTEVPVTGSYSNNMFTVNKQCSTLREWVNINDPEKPQGIIQNLMGTQLEMVRQKMEAEQEALTGDSDVEHETDGVHWKLETQNTGSLQISRWHSTDVKLDDHFVYVAQKPHGTASMSGFLAGLNKTLYIQSMTVYGFTDFHAPGKDSAEQYEELDQRINSDFGGFGDSVLQLKHILNNYVVDALASWAKLHPLKQGSNGQLILLVGPQGMYLAVLGLTDPERLREITDLGVELVKSIRAGA